MVVLLLMHCLLMLPSLLGVLCLLLVLLCSSNLFWGICHHLTEEERAGCYTLIVFPLFCFCKCHVPLLGNTVGCYAVHDCGIVLSYSLTFLI